MSQSHPTSNPSATLDRALAEMDEQHKKAADHYFRLRPQLLRSPDQEALFRAGFEHAFVQLWRPSDETCERRYVWQCSNPSCGQIWEADPHGHCPACLQSNGVGWSCICVFPRHLPAQNG